MKQGLILAGEPMGLLIAQSEGALGSVTGYDLAVAGDGFAARRRHRGDPGHEPRRQRGAANPCRT